MSLQPSPAAVTGTRASAFFLLALANLFWAGNWVIGRALRDAIEPVTLNFWRWLIAALILAPFALPAMAANRGAIRRSAGLLLLLALTGVGLFQTLVYVGLRTTTTVNAVLLNSSAPLFMLLCSWAIERERATHRQIAGMLISLAGILVILARGEPDSLLRLEFHAGDGWILLAMPMWGIYSVLLKRRPPELGGVVFLFLISVAGVMLLAPVFVLEALHTPLRWPPRWPTQWPTAGARPLPCSTSRPPPRWALSSAGTAAWRSSGPMQPDSRCICCLPLARCWQWSFSAKRFTHSTPPASRPFWSGSSWRRAPRSGRIHSRNGDAIRTAPDPRDPSIFPPDGPRRASA